MTPEEPDDVDEARYQRVLVRVNKLLEDANLSEHHCDCVRCELARDTYLYRLRRMRYVEHASIVVVMISIAVVMVVLLFR